MRSLTEVAQRGGTPAHPPQGARVDRDGPQELESRPQEVDL